MRQIFGNLFVPLAWTIFIQVLLCLPLPDLPVSGALRVPHLDKIAHVIVFGVFVALWCFYYNLRNFSHKKRSIIFFVVFLVAMANGVLVEYIQLYFVPNRNFDEGDIIADIISAGIAYGICNVTLLTNTVEKLPR